jgi:hypothetical protein
MIHGVWHGALAPLSCGMQARHDATSTPAGSPSPTQRIQHDRQDLSCRSAARQAKRIGYPWSVVIRSGSHPAGSCQHDAMV